MKTTENLKKTGLALAAAGLLVAAPGVLSAQTSKPASKPASKVVKAVTKAPEWKIDPGHSSLVFSITHFGVSNSWGRFNNLSGTVHFDPNNLEGSSIHVKVDVSSIDTNHKDRDDHLRSDEYFNTEKNSGAEFRSSKIEHAGGKNYKVTGDLTLMGRTETISTNFIWHGTGQDKWGGTRTGADAEFTINRIDWGVGGEGSLGVEVPVKVAIEAIKA